MPVREKLKARLNTPTPNSTLPESDLYIIYSMSNSPYQQWQADLLDFSVQESAQEGVIVRLCSMENHLSHRPPALSNSGYTFVTPSFAEFGRGIFQNINKIHKRLIRKRVSLSHQFYCLNKSFAMQLFLESYQNLRDDAKLLWLDPDMIFVKPWTPPLSEVREGQLLGQYWWGFNELRCRYYAPPGTRNAFIPNQKAIMFPFCITVADMKKIISQFCEFSLQIYRRSHDWQSEMYALVLALFEADVKINTLPNFGTCNNWRDGLSDDPEAFIAHYTQPMEDASGNIIWNKRTYTPSTLSSPWIRPPEPEAARTLTDRRTLKLIHTFIDQQEML